MDKHLQKLFEPRLKASDLGDISPQIKVERAEIVRQMANGRGFEIVNEYVMATLDGLQDSIRSAPPEQLKGIQGRIDGIQAYQNAVNLVLVDGDAAKLALEEDAETRKEMQDEGPPR